MQLSKAFERQEVNFQVVRNHLTASNILSGTVDFEFLKVTAGINHICEVIFLVISVERGTGGL